MSLSTTSTCLEVPPREQQCAHGIASFVLGKKEIVLVEGSFIKKYFYSKRSVSLPGSAGGGWPLAELGSTLGAASPLLLGTLEHPRAAQENHLSQPAGHT